MPDWHAANQRSLVRALEGVRLALERHVGAPAAVGTGPEGLAAPDDAGPESALERLCAAFNLSPFERSVLLLCAGADLDGRFPPLVATAQGDPRRVAPTFGLALAALPGAHWSAITPAGPLRRWRLVEVLPGDALTASPLRVSEWALHFLAGAGQLEERLQGLVRPLPAPPPPAPGQRDLVERIAPQWRSGDRAAPPVLQLCGADAAARAAVAHALFERWGLETLALRPENVPPGPAEREQLARLWEREAVLLDRGLLVELEDGAPDGSTAAVAAFLDSVRACVVVSADLPLRGCVRAIPRFEVPPATGAEREALWRDALGPLADRLDGAVSRLATQFDLGAGAVRDACASVGGPAGIEASALERRVWDASRLQARPRLDGLAQRIEPAAGWDDLVLPESQRRTLREIAAHVRQRDTVYERWGFARQGSRGLGISALFAGASGTGKTMAAEVLANEIRLDLYRIDLSAVVSKYIGETEKNLSRIFDAAEEGGAILLFDEADALFGKRSEVKDSHDRYANIEVSYLLQRMESYRGLAILTTNLQGALDRAFLRRIRFLVHFPFPDPEQREEIWRRVLPSDAPREGLDYPRLARLTVAGGNIRNVAMNAAFLAADAGEPITMRHLLSAARSECAKIDKPLTDAEIAGWV